MKTTVRFYLAIFTIVLTTTSVFGNQTSTFEFGVRRWQSTGNLDYGFKNFLPKLFGNPTSTLEWKKLDRLSLEGFFRFDHRTSFYLKGIAGISSITDGVMIDQDFYIGQIKLSDTSSEVLGSNMYANIDAGMAYTTKNGSRVGGFVGGQTLRSKLTAIGVRDNFNQEDQDILDSSDVVKVFTIPHGYGDKFDGIPVIVYRTNWNLLRFGVDGKLVVRKFSLEGEMVCIPLAFMMNYDDHVLRNISDFVSNYGFGFQGESFLNYKLTPKNEIGIGFRYWKLNTNIEAKKNKAISSQPKSELTRFVEVYYNILLQFKFFL